MQTNSMMNNGFSTPSVVTKQLKMNEVNGRRKVRISSNFISQMGFDPGARIVAVPSIAGGFDVRPSEAGTSKVHQRSYKRQRSNNPLESLMEFSSSELLNSTFPPATERFHVKMRQGEIQVRPIPNRVFNITRRFKGHDPYHALVAMTGGVDLFCLDRAGFKSDVVIEYRPQESRDLTSGRNLEEIHALNTLRNGSPRVLINEDIYQVNPEHLKSLCDEGNPLSLGHFSLQCDDFSSAKSKSLKQTSIENYTSTLDMIVPTIRNIEVMEYPVVLIENVRAFRDHDAGVILKSMLTRMGYNIHEMVLNARDHGGIQNRTRYYLVATIFPGFEEPNPSERKTDSIWPIVEKHLADCRDVTDTNFIANREASGRGGALITKNSTFSPTFVKSQSRGIKDGNYIAHEGRILAPSEGLIQDLMSVPEDFDVSWMGKEQAVETLGQSIDYRLHHEVIKSIRQHIEQNLGSAPVITHRHQASLI